jgi:hypothetical protein
MTVALVAGAYNQGQMRGPDSSSGFVRDVVPDNR